MLAQPLTTFIWTAEYVVVVLVFPFWADRQLLDRAGLFRNCAINVVVITEQKGLLLVLAHFQES